MTEHTFYSKYKLVVTGLVLAVVIAVGYIYLFPITTITVQEPPTANTATALFANGCFWCVEADFEKLPGVVKAVSGYAGGTGENPTYKNYADTDHREVVEVTYESARVSYAELAEYMIKHGDPTDTEGSFYDRGQEYAPALYYATNEEKLAAQKVIRLVDAKQVFDKPLPLAVLSRPVFWPAEEYHQDYYKKNPVRYAYYRKGSGRDAFIEAHWGTDTGPTLTQKEIGKRSWREFVKPSDKDLRDLLTPLQYEVTQHEVTEQPFQNEYDTNKVEGIYVDVVSGEPLFDSIHKYDSGTGWPSFTEPLAPENIVLKEDNYLVYSRTEVRSRYGDSHVGHVFNDGPKDRGGLRYCMNSAALRFIPKEKLIEEGYGEYLALFE